MSYRECLVIVHACRFLQFVQRFVEEKRQLVLSEFSEGFSSGKEKKKGKN